MRTASALAMPPPKQKPVTPSLPVLSGRAFSHTAAAYRSSAILARSTLPNSSPPLSSSPGIAAHRRQAVGRERHEVLERETARDVFDVRIESAVLVHDQDARQLGACRRSPGAPGSP